MTGIVLVVVGVVAALVALKVVWWVVKKAVWATVLSIAVVAAVVVWTLLHFGVLRF